MQETLQKEKEYAQEHLAKVHGTPQPPATNRQLAVDTTLMQVETLPVSDVIVEKHGQEVDFLCTPTLGVTEETPKEPLMSTSADDFLEDLLCGAEAFILEHMKEEQLIKNIDSLPHGGIRLHANWRTPKSEEGTKILYNCDKVPTYASYAMYKLLDKRDK